MPAMGDGSTTVHMGTEQRDTARHPWGYGIGVLVVVLVALGLRLWGVGWSLPYVDHPDEPAVVDVLLRVTQGPLNTEHFFYPSLILYLQAAVLKVHLWAGTLTGLYPETFTPPRSNHLYTTIPEAFIWLRAFSAFIGTATVLALATWSARYVGLRAALLAGALLACSAWAIVHAHYITVDGPAGLFALLALLAALQVLRRGTWRDYLLAGVLVGLATGAKYQNALVVVSLVLAHGFSWRQAALRQSWRLVLAGGVSVGVFLLTSPFIVLDFSGFLRDMQTLFDSYGAGYGDVGHAWPFGYYLRFHWFEALGPLPFGLALVGAGVLLRRDPALALVLLAFPLLLIVSLLRMETHFYRNLLPAQAPLLLLAGVGAVALWDGVRHRLPAQLAHPVAVLLLVVLLIPSFIPAYAASARLAQPDTRVVAQEWAYRAYPGVRIASELSHPLRWQGVAQSNYLHFLPLYDIEWYRQQGYGLLMTNGGRRDRHELADAYDALLTEGSVVLDIGGRGSGYLGPRIELIDVGLTPETMPASEAYASVGPMRLLGATYGRLVRDTRRTEMRPHARLRPGDILAINAFWMVEQPVPPGEYMVFVHLRDQNNQTLVQRDTPPWQGLFPLEHWPVGELVVESLDLHLPEALPPGEYRLVIGLYNPSDWSRFPATASGQRLADDEVEIGTLEVVAE